MDVVVQWIVGLLVVSLLIGHVVTRAFVTFLKGLINTPDPALKLEAVNIPPLLRKTMVGLVERTFFTIVIAAGLTGTAVAMIAWTAIKGSLYWSHYQKHPEHVLTAMLGSLVSLLWAVIGAFICNGKFWIW